MVFQTSDARQKIAQINLACEAAMQGFELHVPETPARDAQVLSPELHPKKIGLSYKEGQARLLHDLGNIEIQAMELALRTLIEYPDAPMEFRESLLAITKSEAEHFELCLNGIETLGFKWGDWPIHNMLWQTVSSEDSLLDRILIVHRYLEGSGLDAGDTLLRRLDGVLESPLHPIVKRIFTDEVGHVDFGSKWYRNICKLEGLDPQEDFPLRMNDIRYRLPKRFEKVCHGLRLQAGFSIDEIEFMESWREQIRQNHRPSFQ